MMNKTQSLRKFKNYISNHAFSFAPVYQKGLAQMIFYLDQQAKIQMKKLPVFQRKNFCRGLFFASNLNL